MGIKKETGQKFTRSDQPGDVRVRGGKDMAHADATMVQERVSMVMDPDLATALIKPVQARKTKLACLGIPSDILEKGSQEYARCVRLANAYKKARVKELTIAHGFVSSGVAALLASEALAISASRFLYAAAAESGEVNSVLLKTASQLADSGRQSGLAAWELAQRESVVKKKNDMNAVDVPWMTGGVAATVKRGRGRPRKDQPVVITVEGESNAG